jgi:hypothetical protein
MHGLDESLMGGDRIALLLLIWFALVEKSG